MATSSNSSSAPFEAQNSPKSRQSRRSAAARGLSSPSASPPSLPISVIVDQEIFLNSSSSTSLDSLPIKEADSSALAVGAEDFHLESGENGGASKKPVWKKPSNGAIGVVAEAGAVMGAESWPALRDSARASPKSASTYSVTVSQEDMVGSSLTSPKEVGTTILNSPSMLSRQKHDSSKPSRISSHIIVEPENRSLQSPRALVDAPTTHIKFGGGPVEEIDNNKNGQRGISYHGNESQPQRNYRRNNSGPITRGDGTYHSNHGGRRDQKQDWGNRSFKQRESDGFQQRTSSRPFVRGTTPIAPFVPPPPVLVRPYVAPMVYTEMASPVYYIPGHPDSLRSMPMVSMPSMFFAMHDPHLPSKIVNQIEYYFSNENLVKDIYLRQNMDCDGWVSINLIAGFTKVMELTNNIQLILDVIKASNVLEVQGDKVRRKNDWMKWIMTPQASPQSINSSGQNMLATVMKSVTLDEKTNT